jgi:LPS-assembly protein
MKSKLGFFGVAFAAMTIVLSARADAAQVTTKAGQEKSGEINVTADKISAADGANQIEASGNVEIKRQEMTLKAGEVRFNRQTQDVEASGRVSIEDPEWKVRSADSIKMNMATEAGVIENGDVFLEEGHVSISGRRFQKFGGQTYHVDDGFFTTCLCESGSPSWKFSAEQMDLTLEGSGTIRNGYLYVLDVPVFYLPYGIFPLRSERQTGFLFPKFGQSTKEGFRYQQPFFWAISRSTDATLEFDLESRARIGMLGEFRTKFDRESDFAINSSYFNESLRRNARDAVVDRTIADQDIPRDRWSIIGTHRYTTASDWLTFSDFAAYRDDLFTRELIERFDLSGASESNIRRSRFGESNFGVFKSWSDTFFKTEMNLYQDFIQPDKITLQRTPQVSFWGRRFLANLPLEFRWRAETVSYVRREGGDGLRLDLRPEVVLPFRLASHLVGSLSVAPRETAYHLYSPVKSNDRNVSRELVEMRANIGTSVSRVFGFNRLGMSQIKHVAEPELSYLFVPSADQSRIPIMDGVDRMNRRNVITLALANRVWGKSINPLLAAPSEQDTEYLSPVVTGPVRELASLRLALGYDIDKERKGGDSLTDLDIKLRLNPLNYLLIGFDGGVDPGPWKFTNIKTTLSIADPRPITRRSLDPDFNQPNSFSLRYQVVRLGTNAFLAEDANVDLDVPATPSYCAAHTADPRCPGSTFNRDVGGSLINTLFYHLADNLLFSASSTYDGLHGRFIGFRTATKILSSCECWSMTLGLKRDINPAKTSFRFDFTLLGLGSSKSSLK